MQKLFGVILGVMVLVCCAHAGGLAACPTSISPEAFTILEGTGCEIGDYEFQNFVVSSGVIDTTMSNVTASFVFGDHVSPWDVTFNLNDTADFITSFTLTYTVTIDETAAPAATGLPGWWYIDQASAGLQDNGGGGDGTVASWEKSAVATTGWGSGNQTDNDNNGTTTNGPVIFPLNAQALNVTDTFVMTTLGSGVILDLSNKYYQTAPEPATMVMIGVALIALGVAVRKRRAARA